MHTQCAWWLFVGRKFWLLMIGIGNARSLLFSCSLCLFSVSSIGDKKRAERAQLNSADGDTAEFHDQFYRDHKLLLVLFRALAVMPITRSAPGKPLSLGQRRCLLSTGRQPLHKSSLPFFTFTHHRKSVIPLEIIGHDLCHLLLHRNDHRRILCGKRTDSHTRRNEKIRWKDLRVHFCHIFGATLLGERFPFSFNKWINHQSFPFCIQK